MGSDAALIYCLLFYNSFGITLLASFFKRRGSFTSVEWIIFNTYLCCLYSWNFCIYLEYLFFLFEKRSILDTELVLQVLPIFMMILILYIIKRNVDLDAIPGFEKLSGLMWIIGIVLCLMWVIDRTHLYAISFVPFYYVLFLLLGGILAMRFAFKK